MFGSSSFGQKSSHFGSQKTNVAPTHRQNSSPSGSTSSFFGPSSSPAFGTSPAYERNTAEFGQKKEPGYRQTRPAFGTPSIQAFGTTSSSERTTSTFGATNTTGFGASGTFGFSPCCENSAACPFRDPSSQSKFGPSFRQSESSSFGQSFGASSPSRSSPSSKKSAASPFGTQSFPSKFGQSNLGGSRQVPYARTTEWDPLSHEPVMFQSISAMKAYKDRSHEELRWEDYRGREKTQTARDAGFSSAVREDQKINEKVWLAETLDTEIKRWANGKEGKLRALLSNLQHILGPDSGWKPISLTDRTVSVEVKKAYRQATLHVHPDKLQQRGASSRQKYICEGVFHLLQAAWSKFNR